MVKAAAGALALFVLTLMTAGTVQQGCQDVKNSWLHLAYYPKRDMRSSVALLAQRGFYRGPDSVSVPVTGRDYETNRDILAAKLTNPVAPTDSSIARGQRKFMRTCTPCHGTSMAGDGPVAAKFIPPPDLLAAMTRNRKDGYIYSYIRHGGAIMPSYGAQVTAEEAWDLINFIRYMQKTNPR
jgi:mono/diheme cytochrome c family protein